MKKIVKYRGDGKTTELIKMSAETGFYIVTQYVDLTYKMSIENNIDIPFPISFDEFIRNNSMLQ